MYELVKPKFPLCCEAFEDYVVNAITFSKQEMKVLKELVGWIETKAFEPEELSKRERTEFLEKIGESE